MNEVRSVFERRTDRWVSRIRWIRIYSQAVRSRLLQQRFELYLDLVLARVELLAERGPIDDRQIVLRNAICDEARRGLIVLIKAGHRFRRIAVEAGVVADAAVARARLLKTK